MEETKSEHQYKQTNTVICATRTTIKQMSAINIQVTTGGAIIGEKLWKEGEQQSRINKKDNKNKRKVFSANNKVCVLLLFAGLYKQ